MTSLQPLFPRHGMFPIFEDEQRRLRRNRPTSAPDPAPPNQARPITNRRGSVSSDKIMPALSLPIRFS
jgi:hypothetical protein